MKLLALGLGRYCCHEAPIIAVDLELPGRSRLIVLLLDLSEDRLEWLQVDLRLALVDLLANRGLQRSQDLELRLIPGKIGANALLVPLDKSIELGNQVSEALDDGDLRIKFHLIAFFKLVYLDELIS